jgi:hypothetical protein
VTYSFDIPRPAAFKALYDRTGWGDHELDVFERALEGSWLVASARQGDVVVGIGRVISDGARTGWWAPCTGNGAANPVVGTLCG